MSIEPRCNHCGATLDQFGAVLLSPPLDGEAGLHRKYHVCARDWIEVFEPLLTALDVDIDLDPETFDARDYDSPGSHGTPGAS